ncbi:MAG: hypothetical protein M0019_10405 [Actinomycetota bacterium]|nr:hypothetical protein [Actinomycetota bacterium]
MRRVKVTLRILAWTMVSAVAIVSKPSLYLTALLQLKAFTRRRWWASFPYLPTPSMSYLRFRMETLYGSVDALPPSKDLLEYLEWCRTQRRIWV